MKRSPAAALLARAAELVDGDRRDAYGEPADFFAAVARRWTDQVGELITARDVALMMATFKQVRAELNPGYTDGYLDAAAYHALAYELDPEADRPAATTPAPTK